MKMKRILGVSLAVCLALNTVVFAKTVSSEGDADDLNEPIVTTSAVMRNETELNIESKSAVLLEPYTGQILYEKNSSEATAPASITKIMSLVLIMEAIDKKSLTLNEVVTASEHASGMGGSQIWLKEGENMTVDDLLKATVIASANDATVALAEKVCGSEEAFVAKMNKKAGQLGMKQTVFKNSTGLDEDGHETTAYDVALMSAELIKHSLIKRYSTVWMDSLRNGESELVNTNKLVRFYEGTTGLKTGTTSKAGCCLSATAKRGTTELVAVIMGAPSSKVRFSDAKKLLDYGFANYSFEKVKADKDSRKLTVSVENGTKKQIICEAKGCVNALIKKGEAGEITQKTNIKDGLSAPVKKGQVIGTVDVYIDKEQIGKIDITATEDCEKIKYLTELLRIFKGLISV